MPYKSVRDLPSTIKNILPKHTPTRKRDEHGRFISEHDAEHPASQKTRTYNLPYDSNEYKQFEKNSPNASSSKQECSEEERNENLLQQNQDEHEISQVHDGNLQDQRHQQRHGDRGNRDRANRNHGDHQSNT